MCDLCQYQLKMDHETMHDLTLRLCSTCGRFRRDPEDGDQPCYHCFVKLADLDDCEICAKSPL